MTQESVTVHRDMHYLQLLSHTFPTVAAASSEIINLEAILHLPKGTEHFWPTCTERAKPSNTC